MPSQPATDRGNGTALRAYPSASEWIPFQKKEEEASVILHQFVSQIQNRTYVEVLCHNYKAIIIFCATTIAKPEVAIRN